MKAKPGQIWKDTFPRPSLVVIERVGDKGGDAVAAAEAIEMHHPIGGPMVQYRQYWWGGRVRNGEGICDTAVAFTDLPNFIRYHKYTGRMIEQI